MRWLFATASGICLAVVFLVTLGQVVQRYVFHMPMPWATDVTRISFIYSVFFGMGVGVFRACSLKNIVKGVKVCQNSWLMEISQVQYERIADCFPVHRGNVAYDNLRVLNAILYVMENGCKWRRLPEKFGNWHTIYVRMSRWYKSGVLDKVFERLQHERLLRMRLEAVCLDSSCVKVHPDGTGALKKGGLNLSASLVEDGPPRFIWLPRVPIVR